MLTPPENGAGELSGRKMSTFPRGRPCSKEKLGSRVVKVKKIMYTVKFMYICTTPNKKIENHWEPPYKLCLKKACLLCSPPSSALVMSSFFSLGSPIVDIHMVKTRLGTGVPRSPESNAPIRSLYAPAHFPRNQPVLASYSGQYLLSFVGPLTPPPSRSRRPT